jgi:dihydrofolate reductase
MITLIAAIGRKNELGLHGRLLWSIPEDLQHFKTYTLGKVVVMGSNTFFSIGKTLPGRKNVILTSSDVTALGILSAHSIESVLSVEHCYPELVIIGGASVYRQTINFADKLIITHVDAEFLADAFFPVIDLTKWEINSTIDRSNETYKYKFVEYIRNESSRNTK